MGFVGKPWRNSRETPGEISETPGEIYQELLEAIPEVLLKEFLKSTQTNSWEPSGGLPGELSKFLGNSMKNHKKDWRYPRRRDYRLREELQKKVPGESHKQLLEELPKKLLVESEQKWR